ncbi:MAG: class I SAM-dependent methyltransferase [Paenalcaligenes sp.]
MAVRAELCAAKFQVVARGATTTTSSPDLHSAPPWKASSTSGVFSLTMQYATLVGRGKCHALHFYRVLPMFRDLIDDLDDISAGPEILLDVPFVPTDDSVIKKMLGLARVKAKDVLYDLGCGDGRIVIAAAKVYGAQGIGVEMDPLRVADAMENAAHARVEHLVDFIEESIFTVDISDATVVTLYLLEAVNLDLRPRLLSELRPGTRIISHAFSMGDWKADEELELSGISIYKWVVPAQVEGAWEWEGLDGKTYYVELQQSFQEITGTAWIGDTEVELSRATLHGDSLELHIQEVGNTAHVFTLIFAEGDVKSVFENV